MKKYLLLLIIFVGVYIPTAEAQTEAVRFKIGYGGTLRMDNKLFLGKKSELITLLPKNEALTGLNLVTDSNHVEIAILPLAQIGAPQQNFSTAKVYTFARKKNGSWSIISSGDLVTK